MVRVRTIKYIQGMNRKFDKSNKCDPTLYQGAFIFQTDGGRCGEVPREATGEIWPIGRGEGRVVEQDTPHKAPHYFSAPPPTPPVGDLAECASPGAQLSQGNSALLFIYLNNKWNEAENEAE